MDIDGEKHQILSDYEESRDEWFYRNVKEAPDQEFEMVEVFIEEYKEIIPAREVIRQRWKIR